MTGIFASGARVLALLFPIIEGGGSGTRLIGRAAALLAAALLLAQISAQDARAQGGDTTRSPMSSQHVICTVSGEDITVPEAKANARCDLTQPVYIVMEAEKLSAGSPIYSGEIRRRFPQRFPEASTEGGSD